MLELLKYSLMEQGYTLNVDDNGIFLPKQQIDIILDESFYVINSKDNEIITAIDVNEAVSIINDLSYSDEISRALDENNYAYTKDSPRFFSINNNKIKIIDGRFYLENNDGEISIFINIPQLIGALQSKFLGE